jgi:hypothetical protein
LVLPSEKRVEMNASGISSGLASTLRSLAVGQLQIQASRSATLDAIAIGVMGIDIAVGTVIVGFSPAHHHLWIAPFVMLSLSFSLAMRTLLLQGARRDGPLIVDVLNARARYDDATLEASVLEHLATDMLADRRDLARKKRPIPGALTALAFAIVVELVGAIH